MRKYIRYVSPSRVSFDDREIVALIMSGLPDRACNDLDLDRDRDDLDGWMMFKALSMIVC